MLQEFQKKLKSFRLQASDPILLAISGGLDSVVLLHLLTASGYRPVLAHYNYRLRGEDADADQALVENLAKELGLSLHFETVPEDYWQKQGKNDLQAKARALRYHFFEKLQSEYRFKAILTAHHLNDQAETALLQIGRGRPVHGIAEKRGLYLRPLLDFTKEELRNFAVEQGLQWREDRSNQSLDYRRNQIRHQIIPHWKEAEPLLWPSLRQSLALTQRKSASLKALLEEKLAEHLKDGRLELNDLPRKAYWAELLWQWLRPYGDWDWQSLEQLWQGQSGGMVEQDNWQVYLHQGAYILGPKPSPQEPITIKKDTEIVEASGLTLRFSTLPTGDLPSDLKNPNHAYLDFNQLQFPLVLRRWKEGDRFQPFGMQGQKKLSDYCNDLKLDPFEKARQMVLCSGEEIAWVIGHRIGEEFKCSNSTKTLYFVEIL